MADQQNTQQSTQQSAQQNTQQSTASGRRRSSIERFAGFTKLSKEGASDTGFHDQRAKSGIVGSLWNTYIKGHPTQPTTKEQK